MGQREKHRWERMLMLGLPEYAEVPQNGMHPATHVRIISHLILQAHSPWGQRWLSMRPLQALHAGQRGTANLG